MYCGEKSYTKNERTVGKNFGAAPQETSTNVSAEDGTCLYIDIYRRYMYLQETHARTTVVSFTTTGGGGGGGNIPTKYRSGGDVGLYNSFRPCNMAPTGESQETDGR